MDGRNSVTDKDKKFFSPLRSPDLFWGPSTFYVMGNGKLYHAEVKWLGHEADF
jgi:hypothetical protein